MKSLLWDRDKRVDEIRDRIWSYVSLSAEFEKSALLVAAALLKWPEADALRLGELQFLLSEEVGAFILALPGLVRRLATSSAREEQWSNERLHGPVQWNQTLSLRGATGSRQIFVTAPAKRVHQTSENELLVHVLDAIVRVTRSGGWDQSRSGKDPARMVRERLSKAEKWQQSRMLSSVERTPPTSRDVARIRSGRTRQRYTSVLAAYDRLMSLVERLDRQAIRSAVEHAALVTAHDPTLFELLTTFHLVDALHAHGWPLRPFYLLRGHVHAQGHRSDGRQIHLWYQVAPTGLTTRSQYRQILWEHGFSNLRPLRPDIVLRWTDPNGHIRWLVVECKLRRAGVEDASRAALADLLSYRRAFGATLTSAGTPYGLGVAWGEGLQPVEAEIALCTPDTLNEAVGQIVI
jgi:hypothetical protein